MDANVLYVIFAFLFTFLACFFIWFGVVIYKKNQLLNQYEQQLANLEEDFLKPTRDAKKIRNNLMITENNITNAASRISLIFSDLVDKINQSCTETVVPEETISNVLLVLQETITEIEIVIDGYFKNEEVQNMTNLIVYGDGLNDNDPV